MLLTIALGNWQSGRASEKEALRVRLEALEREPPVALGEHAVVAGELDLRQVVARGHWVPERMVLLDNKVLRGVVGYHVLMPLRIESSSMHVLVNRGWIAAKTQRTELPEVTTPTGRVEIQGTARIPTSRFLELSARTAEGRVWQNVTIERFNAWSNLELQPVLIQQTSQPDDALVREWERPDLGIDKHRGYALQWYSLTALTAILLGIFSFRRVPA